MYLKERSIMINIERLKDARSDEELRQEDIAKKLNISKSGYTRYENELDDFPIMHLINTCDMLNISLDYIFNLVNFKNYFNYKKDYNNEKLKIRLKELRIDKRITQHKLAELLNINRSTISKYETGKHLIATPFLYTICKKYNLSADYLLGKIDSPKYLK